MSLDLGVASIMESQFRHLTDELPRARSATSLAYWAFRVAQEILEREKSVSRADASERDVAVNVAREVVEFASDAFK